MIFYYLLAILLSSLTLLPISAGQTANYPGQYCWITLDAYYRIFKDGVSHENIGLHIGHTLGPTECNGSPCCIEFDIPDPTAAKELTIGNTESLYTGECRCTIYSKPKCSGEVSYEVPPNCADGNFTKVVEARGEEFGKAKMASFRCGPNLPPPPMPRPTPKRRRRAVRENPNVLFY
ncbi:hypothetical protein TWF696_000243 [Orbilia brochopaga]|uniref:Uncharacterized protein n=1 Tax=Orbilia brochopaga TaxID=3140254 RepID=A0AAV9VAU1_9PEZI